jgi:hypothetical protein
MVFGFLEKTESSGEMKTEGRSGRTSAMMPCFSSALVIYIAALLLGIASDLYDVLQIGTPTASDARIVHELSDGLTWWAWKGVTAFLLAPAWSFLEFPIQV